MIGKILTIPIAPWWPTVLMKNRKEGEFDVGGKLGWDVVHSGYREGEENHGLR